MARMVFMGTPDFAVPLADACAAQGELVAVVCQPDKPKGRGGAVSEPAVKQWAVSRGVPVWQPTKIKTGDFEAQLRAAQLDVAVVAAYGRILPLGVLQAPRLGCLNVHASLLPKLRGAAPIQWAIARGERETGVCLMQMDEGLDTGPVLARRTLAIADDETGGSLFEKLSVLGRELLVSELPRFLRGELSPQPQDHAQHTLAPLLDKQDGALDWTRPAAELALRVRAFHPWPGTFTHLNGKLLKVSSAHAIDGQGPPGTVLRAGPELVVACGGGALSLIEVQLEGKKRMPAADFLVGAKLAAGQRLG